MPAFVVVHPDRSDPKRIVILKADLLNARAIEACVVAAYPDANVVHVQRAEAAWREIERCNPDLLITGLDAALGDVFDLVCRVKERGRGATGVLVVTGRREAHVVATLRSISVEGVFDTSNDDPRTLSDFVSGVLRGERCWSNSLIRRTAREAIDRANLTPTEQMVLMIIGDGSDDTVAADVLGLRAYTVQSIRRDIHAKLHVTHKGELVRAAAEHGFVLISGDGIVRPGLSRMLNARRAREHV